MRVGFVNPKTGEMREVKVGWSWTLFLFSGFLGIPLFLRKLNTWGFVFMALWAVNFFSGMAGSEAAALSLLVGLIFLGLQIWMGVKGNEMTAKNYLELGWDFAEKQSETVKFARGKWGIRGEEVSPVTV
jgi:hypothetical protein